MIDRKKVIEKVIDVLERCMNDPEDCEECPYSGTDGWCGANLVELPREIVKHAIALLKEQDNMLRFIAKICLGETDASTIELILRKLTKLGYIDIDGNVWRLKDD